MGNVCAEHQTMYREEKVNGFVIHKVPHREKAI